jgi:hypothetical protein
VATVDSKGQIKGIGVGSTTIVLSAGQKKKELKINVLGAKTTLMALSKEFVVLKPGETYKISAKVEPVNAIQKLTFQSGDSKVATVSDDGLIKAVSVGSTFIIVSNGDMTASVSIIVNKNSSAGLRGSKSASAIDDVDSGGATATHEIDAEILSAVSVPDASVVISQEKLPVVTASVLKALSENNASLIIEASEYTLEIYGSDIVNPLNEFSTLIDFTVEENGLAFVLNGGENMPGRVVLEFKDWIAGQARNDTVGSNDVGFRYLYLYNESSGKYQRLSVDVRSALVLDDSGKYLLSSEKLGALTLKVKWIIGSGIVILLGMVAFVIIRKKYWFW